MRSAEDSEAAAGIWEHSQPAARRDRKIEPGGAAKNRRKNPGAPGSTGGCDDGSVTGSTSYYRLGCIAPCCLLCYGFYGGCYGGQCGIQSDLFSRGTRRRSTGRSFVRAEIRRRDSGVAYPEGG